MKHQHIMHNIDIVRIKGNTTIRMQDHIIDEDILHLFINGKKAFEMVFSMTHTRALAAGFLYTQGIVHDRKEIENIDFDADKKHCHVQLSTQGLNRLALFEQQRQVKGSSGGMLLQNPSIDSLSNPDPDFVITPKQVLNLISQHWDHSQLFHKTGAVHSAGLCSPEKIVSYYEDIGRHNALDKLAGAVLLQGTDTRNKVATVSCRMSLEIVGKLIRTKIPIVISNAAPTLSAVKLAQKAGLTVVGFARENRFNIYTHEQRILYPGT